MGKGIKMRSAQDPHGTPWPVEALQTLHDGHNPIPDLVCDHTTCKCAVRFVPRYQQNRSNRIEPIDVPAYIGLRSHSEHVTGCKYGVPGRLKAIAAQSDPDFLKLLQAGKHELRLLTLHNGLRTKTLSGVSASIDSATSDKSTGKASTEFSPSAKTLTSYLRTTADLLVLRAACESDEFLASELILQFGEKRIAWKDFFFTQDRYDEAWEQVRTSGNEAYPIALAGTVLSLHVPGAGAKYRNSFLNCKSLYRKTEKPDRLDKFEANIANEDAAWLKEFSPDTEILMFGIWKAQGPTDNQGTSKRDPSKQVTYVTHKLMLEPGFKRQIIKIEA